MAPPWTFYCKWAHYIPWMFVFKYFPFHWICWKSGECFLLIKPRPGLLRFHRREKPLQYSLIKHAEAFFSIGYKCEMYLTKVVNNNKLKSSFKRSKSLKCTAVPYLTRNHMLQQSDQRNLRIYYRKVIAENEMDAEQLPHYCSLYLYSKITSSSWV